MIPKIIHYCWLSGEPYPELVSKCINSWKKHLPDYELMLWDTQRIDINSNLWLKQAFSCKKYAFAADYIRFYALYHHGGIYLDADVEVLHTFNGLLDRTEFVGEEAGGDIESAVLGVERHSSWIKECLEYYTSRPFIKPDGSYDISPVPLLVNKVLAKYPKIQVFPYQYFSPKDYNIGKVNVSSKTYCIHHFDGKWVKKGYKYKIKRFLHKVLYCLLGRKGHNRIVHFIRVLK